MNWTENHGFLEFPPKVEIFSTLRRSSGVNNTFRQSLSLQSIFWDSLWENETLGLKRGDRQRGSTTKNIDILTLDVCLPPHIFISFAMISNNKLFRNSTWTLLAHLDNSYLFTGTWRLIEMVKWVPAEPTTDTVSGWDKVISSCRITLVSDIPWNSKTWLSIDGFTCLIN